MATRQLGDISIDRIIELEEPLATPLEVFDEAVPDSHRFQLKNNSP